MVAISRRLIDQLRAPAVATLPAMATSNGLLYLLAGVCALVVTAGDTRAAHRALLLAVPVLGILAGVCSLLWGRRWPRWSYHPILLAGCAMITAIVHLAEDRTVAMALVPLYLFAVLDGAFYFAVWGLFVQLGVVLLLTTFALPRDLLPWQMVLMLDAVFTGSGFLAAFLSRAGDAVEVDALTGLLNRRGIDRHLDDAVKRAHDGGLCVILLDLDAFKRVNDAQGHQLGDELLRECADRWSKLVPRGVEIGRYGGDEFALIAPGWTAEEGVMVAEALRTAAPKRLTASAGVAVWERGDTAVLLLERADVALYAAKTDGGDRTVAYGQRDDPSDEPPSPGPGRRPPRLRSI